MVVLPTYNEAENLPKMVDALLSLPISDLYILVVDDSSPDGTGQIAEEIAKTSGGRVLVLHREGKLGLGTAYVAGFKRALAEQADHIVEMDADFSHDPACLPAMLERLQDYDVVVGSRYIEGGRVDPKWSAWRKVLSAWGSAYSRAILGLEVHDPTGGFKCFHRKVIEALDLDQIRSNGYAFQIEMAHLCQANGFRVYEFPIQFADRVRGKSKMSARIALEASFRVWQIKWRS